MVRFRAVGLCRVQRVTSLADTGESLRSTPGGTSIGTPQGSNASPIAVAAVAAVTVGDDCAPAPCPACGRVAGSETASVPVASGDRSSLAAADREHLDTTMAGKSKRLPLLGLLLALALTFAAWSVLRGRDGMPVVALDEGPIAAPGVPERVDTGASASFPEASRPEPEPTPSPATVGAQERVTASTAAELELADAIWVSGRMVWPEGTPIGEQVEITAMGRAFPTRELYRAAVEPSGHFRVAFAPKTRSGSLALKAPHLFLPKLEPLRLKDGAPTEEVLLEPVLGGRVLVQLQLPAADPALAADLVGKSASSYGSSDSPDSPCMRSANVDAALRLELRGLDPRMEHHLNFDSGVVAEVSVPDLTVLSGQDLRLDLPLQLGVRLRGRVHFGSDSRPKDLSLSCVSISSAGAYGQAPAGEEPQEEQAHVERGTIAEDGSFDLRGVRPGRIRLEARGTQRITARHELGVLADGEVRDGIELTLGLGGRIGGRVRWPDGTAAVGAAVVLSDLGEPDADEENFYVVEPGIGRVLADAEGKFEIHGLRRGPFTLLASARPREQRAPGEARAPTWKARAEAVAIDTTGLELVLQAGYSVSGVVVDDTGAPIEFFRVVATRQEGAEGDIPLRVSSAFRSQDGRFELSGLLEGPYELALNLPSFAPSEPVRFQVPADSGPFRLVATRRASISGVVQLPDGTPAAGAHVEVASEPDPSWDPLTTWSSPRGEFRVKAVGAGSVSVRAQLPGFASSQACSLQVGPGQAVENVRLVLRRGARITGEVQASVSGETLSGRRVGGVSTGGASTHESSTDDRGRFTIVDVDPGEYTITLAPSPEEVHRLLLPGDDPGSTWELEQALQKSTTVRVDEGGSAHVVFGASEPARIPIRGRVRRGSEPQALMRVRAVPADSTDGRNGQHALCDGEGRFELAVVHAGSYRVEALPNGLDGLPVGVRVEVPAAGLDGVDLRIPNGRIAGTLHATRQADHGWLQVTLMTATGAMTNAWLDSDEWPDGFFAFENLPAGEYSLLATAWTISGDRPPNNSLQSSRRTVVLGEDQELSDIAIEIHGN